NIPAAIPPAASTVPVSAEDALTVAREELVARLSAEIRPERRALLSRSDLAKLVSGAVQAYFVRHAIESNPLSRRDLITDIMQALITGPGPAGGAGPEGGGSAGPRAVGAAHRRRDRQRHHGQRTKAGLCRTARQARTDRCSVPR